MSRPLPRFSQKAITIDPFERIMAQRQAEIERARTAIAQGQAGQLADPADLRGIPCLASGVGGTQAGTSPHGEAAAGHLDHRLHRSHT